MEHWQQNKRERPGGIKFETSGDFALCHQVEVFVLADLMNFNFLVFLYVDILDVRHSKDKVSINSKCM